MRFGGENVPVVLPGGCQCPETPHPAGDIVYLLPRLSFDGGLAAGAAIREAPTSASGGIDADLLAEALVRAYLDHQVVGWNLTDADGQPVPFSPALLRSDYTSAVEVGNAADDLYTEALLAPLQGAASTSSPRGAKAASTSPRTRSPGRPRKR